MNRKAKKQKAGNWEISFKPILGYSVVFCILVLGVVIAGGGILSFSRMETVAGSSLSSSYAQISQRVDSTIDLLESLAGLPEFYDPTVPPIEKVKKLDQMAPYFDYMMICYVDSDITVYSDGSEPASLASRDYMQRLYSTGERQVTDSFAAGADGVTLNYTVAVPLLDPQGTITGSLFCAIYFDEMEEIIEKSSAVNGTQTMLLGTKGQIMSSTTKETYGDSVMKILREGKIFGITPDKLEEQLLAAAPGSYWSFQGGSLKYTEYRRVDNTGWDILCTVSLGSIFMGILPWLLFVGGLTLLLCFSLLLILRRYITGQMKVVDMLVHSVEELEKKIYQNERPEEMDFKEIIRLTSNGLSDSLTGVVTRSVFFNQAKVQMKNADSQKVKALCFVDMDNLKYINDTYGHSAGDVALKSVSYILREYEKKYDGVVGRYGGDEFVMLLTGLDDESELKGVLDELVLRFQSEVGSAGQRIPIRCSIGVSVYRRDMDLDQMIADADEALYYVKQNGKGYYKIHQN